MPTVLNALGYKTVWLLSLMGVGSGMPWLGALALTLFLVWHLAATRTRQADLTLMGLAMGVGLVADTLLLRSGLLSYACPLPFATVAPFWILLMWANFALTLNASLRWLQGRYVLAGIFGAVGGPLAYLAGIGLGAAQPLVDGLILYSSLALIWALAVPLLVLAASRIGCRAPASPPLMA